MGSDLNMWFWNRVRFAELAGTRAVPLLLPLPAKGVCVVPEGVRMRRAWEHPCGSHCPGAMEDSDAGLPVCVCRRGELGTPQLLWGISAFAQMLL